MKLLQSLFFRFSNLLMFAALFVLTACSGLSPQQSTHQQTITDMLGRQVSVPENPKTVVGLRAGALRLLVYMQLSDKVAGIEEIEKEDGRPYQMAHPELAQLPVVGPAMGGDAELLTALSPDVIVMTFTTKQDADNLQKKTGIPVIALQTGNLTNQRKTFFQALRLLGQLFDKAERADSLILFTQQIINTLDSTTRPYAHQEQARAYIAGVAYSGAHGLSSTNAFYPPFQFTNVYNVASAIDEQLVSPIKGTYIDLEQLISWQPDFLFVDASGWQLVAPDISTDSPIGKSLKAIQNHQVYHLWPHNWYATNYETLLVNACFVGKTVYPQAFKNFDTHKEARRIYQFFLSKDIFDQMQQTYGALH